MKKHEEKKVLMGVRDRLEESYAYYLTRIAENDKSETPKLSHKWDAKVAEILSQIEVVDNRIGVLSKQLTREYMQTW